MTEQAIHTPTLTERDAPRLIEPESDNDDGETIVRGDNVYTEAVSATIRTEDEAIELFHQQVVDFLTEEAKQLAL